MFFFLALIPSLLLAGAAGLILSDVISNRTPHPQFGNPGAGEH
jgi:hypothetical protein